MEVARTEFRPEIPLNTLTDEEISNALNEIGFFDLWVKGLRAEASSRIEHGTEIPGWKLVPKRAIRKWKNDVDAGAWMAAVFGDLRASQVCFDTKLKSPAQIEKICDLDPALWERVSSGSTLAPDTDDRNAVATGPAADFDEETE